MRRFNGYEIVPTSRQDVRSVRKETPPATMGTPNPVDRQAAREVRRRVPYLLARPRYRKKGRPTLRVMIFSITNEFATTLGYSYSSFLTLPD